LQSEAGCEAYAASKGGIWSLTHALAVSLAPYHITVNCIAPGWISVNEDEILRPRITHFIFQEELAAQKILPAPAYSYASRRAIL
jgi:NAD(P)-dependent dehydrogenase (short-subunit alcohol dehydrogenase family)